MNDKYNFNVRLRYVKVDTPRTRRTRVYVTAKARQTGRMWIVNMSSCKVVHRSGPDCDAVQIVPHCDELRFSKKTHFPVDQTLTDFVFDGVFDSEETMDKDIYPMISYDEEEKEIIESAREYRAENFKVSITDQAPDIRDKFYPEAKLIEIGFNRHQSWYSLLTRSEMIQIRDALNRALVEDVSLKTTN